jgi:hypothetical protein
MLEVNFHEYIAIDVIEHVYRYKLNRYWSLQPLVEQPLSGAGTTRFYHVVIRNPAI